MHPFLQFIFDVEKLRAEVREHWIALYDYTYIDDKILGGIEKNLPNVAEILAQVEKKATGNVVSSLTQSSFNAAAVARGSTETGDNLMMNFIDDGIEKKPPTEFKPFNLTKTKPKKIPEPEVINREIKANPVPKHLYRKSLAEIEKDKQERRK